MNHYEYRVRVLWLDDQEYGSSHRHKTFKDAWEDLLYCLKVGYGDGIKSAVEIKKRAIKPKVEWVKLCQSVVQE